MPKKPTKPGKPHPPERGVWTAAAIAKLRDDLKLTQAEAAAKVGVSQSVWSAWERGSRTPSKQTAILLDLLKNKIL